MLNQLKQLFTVPTASELAQHEYDEAQRNLLVSQSAAEYHKSMINYHTTRVMRLEKLINASVK